MTLKYTISLIILLISHFVVGQETSNHDNELLSKKIERRTVHPKSKYLTISGGWFFSHTKTNDYNDFLNQHTFSNTGLIPCLYYEHGIIKNFFLEFGIDRTKIGIGISRDHGDNQSWGQFTTPFSSLKKSVNNNFSFGLGYRIKILDNFNILNVHAGLFAGMSNMNKNDLYPPIGQPYTSFFYEENNNWGYTFIRVIENYSRISFGGYFSLSKDIRLSKEVLLNIKYIHRLGFLSSFSGNYTFESNDISLNDDTNFVVRSGGAIITGGLKILLFKQSLN